MIQFTGLERAGLRLAAMSNRLDGDCGYAAPDSAARAAVLEACGADPARAVGALQVHGARIAAVGEADAGRGGLRPDDAIPDTDGLVTDAPGVPLCVLAADCTPIWLYDPVRLAGGLVHGGREGALARIAEKAVAALRMHYDCDPRNLHALIGPSAGPERYEVSPEIAEGWRSEGLPAEGRRLDLWNAHFNQLIHAGVLPQCIETAGICTISSARFHSYRRDKTPARNLAVLML